MIEGKNFINGEWTLLEKRERFVDLNPANLEVVGVFPEASKEDVEAAVEAARRAFFQWRETSPLERGSIIFRAAQILEKRKDEFAKLITIEEGKTLTESVAEVNRTLDILRFFGGEGWRLCGETIPSESQRAITLTVREPLGVVGVITPWNFPLAIPAWKLCPALIAGNTVVFKPASLTPLVAMEFVKVLHEAGLPKGVINFITGKGVTVGQWLAESRGIDALTFTGSYESGTRVYIKACANLVRAHAEMGGKNAVVIAEDANIDRAVEIVIKGAFSLAGQACTATSRAIVVEKVYDRFITLLKKRVARLRVGHGLEPGIDMGPVASEEQLKRVQYYITLAQAEGAEFLLKGDESTHDDDLKKGFFIKPTVFVNVTEKMRVSQEEIFGPVLCILKARDFEEAIEIANSVEYGLVASICTESWSKAWEFIKRSQTGIVKVNLPTIGLAPNAPFGGIKKSTAGGFKEQGKEAIEFFSTIKTVYITW